MKETVYIPIYEWGEDPDSANGTTSGCTVHVDLNDLYAHNPDAVGYIEMVGYCPTQREFEEKHGIVRSGAV